MSALRRIEALSLPDIVEPELGPKPELLWVAPTDLWVDPTYQRELSDRSHKLLKRVVRQFSWNRMKPPIGARADDGQIHLIDGQHTAIAAATLKILAIPVFIVAAGALHERARSFVAHNTDRVSVQPLAVYKALLAAGDPDAVVCQAVLDRAGIRMRALNQVTETKLGDTGAFGAIQALVKDQGPMRARIVLETLVKGECIPINAHQIRAVNHLLWLNDPRITPEMLAPIILRDGEEGMRGAQVRAKQLRTQVWRVLVARWMERAHAQKTAA